MDEHIEKVMRLLDEGRADEALASASTEIRSSGQPIAWVALALKARDAGDAASAEKILSEVAYSHPGFPAALYELAFLHRLRGDHRGAAALLSRALPHPNPARTQLFLAHMLHASGAHREADATLADVRDTDAAQPDTMAAFGRYLEHNPLGRALVLHDRLLARNKWLTSEQLADQIHTAVAQRRAFALVRFGDGEGGVLRLNALDEALYRPLYADNRQELIAMWFGATFPWRTNGFFEIAADLVEKTSEADVIGIPYESWIKHEYNISSLRGVPSLVNVSHALLAANTSGRQLTSQLAHVELLNSGRLGTLVASARRVSIISCLDMLPEALKAKFDLEEVTFYRIPGEQGSRHVLGEATTNGEHYPQRFLQLQEELSRPHNGRLFLIAGGLLGKLYAITVRRYGGVAVDIGSVVDAWGGYATRPGFQKGNSLTQ